MQIVLPMVKFTPFVCVVCTWRCVRFTHGYLSTHVNNQHPKQPARVVSSDSSRKIPVLKMGVVQVERGAINI